MESKALQMSRENMCRGCPEAKLDSIAVSNVKCAPVVPSCLQNPYCSRCIGTTEVIPSMSTAANSLSMVGRSVIPRQFPHSVRSPSLKTGVVDPHRHCEGRTPTAKWHGISR